jgi:hypothetical protein
MSENIIKFPYDACRRVHSRKPRRSKNGTPEERAAKAAKPIEAAVIPLGKIQEKRSAQEGEHSLSNFLRFLRQYFEQEFGRGKNLDQIFGDLEDTYRRADEAKQRFREGRASETSDFPLDLPVVDLGQSVLNLAAEHDR